MKVLDSPCFSITSPIASYSLLYFTAALLEPCESRESLLFDNCLVRHNTIALGIVVQPPAFKIVPSSQKITENRRAEPSFFRKGIRKDFRLPFCVRKHSHFMQQQKVNTEPD